MEQINIEELKEHYQMEINQLKKQLRGKNTIPHSFANHTDVNENMKRLEQLQDEDTSSMDTESDAYREHVNRMLKIENDIRIKLGLEPKAYNILDSELEFVIKLGAIDDFLSGLEKHQQDEIKSRINTIKFTQERNAEREAERLKFLDDISHRIEQVESYKPERHRVDATGHLVPNTPYDRWKAEILTIKASIEKQVKMAKSLDTDGLEKKDERGSVFKLYDKINKLIAKYDLEDGVE